MNEAEGTCRIYVPFATLNKDPYARAFLGRIETPHRQSGALERQPAFLTAAARIPVLRQSVGRPARRSRCQKLPTLTVRPLDQCNYRPAAHIISQTSRLLISVRPGQESLQASQTSSPHNCEPVDRARLQPSCAVFARPSTSAPTLPQLPCSPALPAPSCLLCCRPLLLRERDIAEPKPAAVAIYPPIPLLEG